MKASLPKTNRAFTLVEIVLALGIVSFAIVGLIGLLTVSFDSGRASDEDTLIASMARQIVTELRAQPFDNLASQAGDSGPIYYFDHEAHLVTSSSDAIYQAQVRITADTDFNTQSTTSGATVNLYEILMPFVRTAAPKRLAIQTLHASIARYD